MGAGDQGRNEAANLDELGRLAAHDLREPLRMVGSYLGLLDTRYADRLDDDGRDYLAYALEGVERMERMLGDLFAYVGLEADENGELPPSTNSEAALKEALANLRAAIDEADADVSASPLPPVRAGEAQLVRVFQNLVGNAIKFRGSEPPRVSVSATRHGGEVAFAVADNGIGIDPADAERVFEPFQRLVGADEYPGTGIGLAICRRIVEGHGGKIWVESEPGRGATFHFILQGGD